MTDDEKSVLGADLQNGKGDFFNDLLVLLLERCATRRALTCKQCRTGRTGRADGRQLATAVPLEMP